MTSIIFRAAAPIIASVMVLFSVIVLLRGHNDPGGGFPAGLIAAAAMVVLGMARGVGTVRRLLHMNPIAIAGLGIILAIASGLPSAFVGMPFLTGFWLPLHIFGTPGAFDIGVYLVVFGTVTAAVLALEDDGEGV